MSGCPEPKAASSGVCGGSSREMLSFGPREKGTAHVMACLLKLESGLFGFRSRGVDK